MGDDEILVRPTCCQPSSGILIFCNSIRLKVALVEAVGDKLHRSLCHCLKLLLHKRGDGYYSRGIVKHFSLHPAMPSFRCSSHCQMLEIEYPGPRVPEIGNPRQSRLLSEPHADQMHGLWRTSTHDKVNRMLFQIFFQKFHGRPYPQATGIRTEKIAPDPHRQLLQSRFVLSIYRVDFHSLLAVPGLS